MRNKVYLVVFQISILLLICVFGSASATVRDPGTHFFNDTFGDFKEELEIAQQEGKKAVMLFFEMDECPFCHRMKTTIMNQSEVQDYFRNNFKMFSVDIEGDVEMSDFDGSATTQKAFSVEKHKVRATPVIAFFDLEGNLLHRYTGATGDADEFLLMGKFIADGEYKNMRFTQYKRNQRKAQ